MDRTFKGRAPRTCTNIQITEANDADKHAHNLTNWQQQYDQVSAGAFYGNIVELHLSDLQVFKEHTSQALRQKCNVWPDSIWLGLPLSSARSTESMPRINGLTVESNAFMCRPGDCEFELMTPKHFNIFGIVVNQQALERAAHNQGVDLNWENLMHQGRLNVPENTLDAIRFLLNRLLQTSQQTPPERLQRDLVMMALLEALQKETHNQTVTPSFSRRKLVVDQIKSYLEHHQDAPVTITELCQVACVSRRTLQYSFETVMGISPLQFLRLSRLNGARRTLSSAAPTDSVANIATQWGFWHLSQFSKDYRLLFGELPSETLGRI